MKAKIIAITILASISIFSGCGNNKSITTKEVVDKPVYSVDKPKQDNNTVTKKQSYCAPVTNIGKISGAIVVSEKGDKAREVNGEYCFDEKPQTVKIASVGGVDSVLGITTKCDSRKLDFISGEALECNSKIPDLNYDDTFLATKERAIMFRSYIGDIYELMGVPFNNYDPIILEAINSKNITSAQKILDDANVTGNKDSEKKEEIVSLMVDLVASPINRDVVTLAILALKSTAQLQDGNFTNGDNNVTKWINDNRDVLEAYILAHSIDPKVRATQEKIIIDIRKLVTQIIKLKRAKKLTTPINLEELEELIELKTIMKFTSSSDIVRGPITDIITLKSSFDNRGVTLYDIHFMNKIDGVTKYYKDDNDNKEVELFTLFQEYIHFNKDINSSLDKFTLIKDYLKDIFTINLKLDYNHSKALPIEGKDLLATLVLDFPCKSECVDKSEYLTLTFPVHVEEIDNELSFVIPADKNVTFTSKIWDINSSSDEPTFTKSIVNVINEESNQLLQKDIINVDIADYVNRASKKNYSSRPNLIKSIKNLLIRHSSNINGEPSPMIQYLSLIDISDPAVIPTTFIKNRAVIKPSRYNLDKSSSFYKDIFTEMYQNNKPINAIAIKTCFTCM
jgi:hypothetical protein